ncbi:MAG: radical SAM protein [Methanoregula sp.]|jgi:radical SAM protein with 4Fe4S-binding SPASM domain|uniref:radical SAM protein n=1 Tax=Methanoregula sp. TaxID=2052170 RepID=UPI0025E69322|nr:radical SAM protein [Methanoregula sp.]MCK9630298.1 radical SAM protein [Methanoregula sp.]
MKVEVDSHKLIYHPERVSEWIRTGDCFPIYVEIGVTNRCNHRCVFCALDWCEKNPLDIDTEVMKRALHEMAECGVKSVMFAGDGEPLMHRDICDLITHARQQGLDVAIATNGVLFNREKLEKTLPSISWVRFSVDAGTPDTHKKIHCGGSYDFQRILTNVRDAVAIKKRDHLPVVLGVQFLLIPDNFNDLIPFIEAFKEIGVDNVQIKPYSQHPLSKNRYSIEYAQYQGIEDTIRRYETPEFQVIFRSQTAHRLMTKRNYHECYGLPFFTLVEADGTIIPCNLFHHNPDFCYGNLNTESFSDIWNGKTRKHILQQLTKNTIEHCRDGCRLDAINRYLSQLKNPHPHVNFI